MSFDSLEASIQDSQPVEFVLLKHGNIEYPIAFGISEVPYDGRIYKPTSAERSSIIVTGVGKQGEVEIKLPINHAFVRRWLQFGMPPLTTATIWRRQADGSVEQRWAGPITSLGWDEKCTVATLRCPSYASEALARTLPMIEAQRECPHMLGDKFCRVDLEAGVNPDGIPYKFTGVAIGVDGRDVTMDLVSVPAGYTFRSKWTRDGKLVDALSGESMTIIDQNDISPGLLTITKLTLSNLIVGLRAGSVISVYVGCDWTNPTCKSKFNNLSHHGGCTFMPYKNPHVPGFDVEEED